MKKKAKLYTVEKFKESDDLIYPSIYFSPEQVLCCNILLRAFKDLNKPTSSQEYKDAWKWLSNTKANGVYSLNYILDNISSTYGIKQLYLGIVKKKLSKSSIKV